MPDTLIHYGGEVKALGEGRVGGYLVRYSDETTPDISAQRDFFTASTDYDVEDGERKSVYYAHGLDDTLKTRRIGTATVTKDDVGIWVEAQLKLRDDYEKHIYAMAEKGKLGWSSGAPSHLVTRKAVGDAHEVLTWNIAEASLTPTPAEPRNDAMALKSLSGLIGMDAGGDATAAEEPNAEPPAAADDAVATKEADTDSALVDSALTFADHLDAVLAAVGGAIERAEDIQSYRIKAGRVISSANREKLKAIHGQMQTTHTAMAAHLEAINNLLLSTDPDAKKDADEVALLRMAFLRMQSQSLGVPI